MGIATILRSVDDATHIASGLTRFIGIPTTRTLQSSVGRYHEVFQLLHSINAVKTSGFRFCVLIPNLTAMCNAVTRRNYIVDMGDEPQPLKPDGACLNPWPHNANH